MGNNNLIQMALTERGDEAIMPEYRDEFSDASKLGLAVSQWAEWDGDKITETYLSALEDANYHTARENIRLLWNHWNEAELA